MRYNALSAPPTSTAAPAPGYSSGQAQAAMAAILDDNLPHGMTLRVDRPDLPADPAGNTALLVFPLCVLLVFLVLAAQYESLIAAAGDHPDRADVLLRRSPACWLTTATTTSSPRSA